MDALQWKRVREIFEEASEVAAPDRSQFLQERCGSEADLVREVEQLLAADSAMGRFLEEPWPVAMGLAPDVDKEQAAFLPGEVLHDRYRIVREVGSGGMGRVYEAFDLELNSRVALKVLRPEISEQPGMMLRFRQEVSSAYRVTHPNVCRTYQLERTTLLGANGSREITFLTMEFLEGVTLRAHLKEGGPLGKGRGLRIAGEIAAALDAAHRAGIVHGDMKPGNILLCGQARDRAVITDFGLARICLQDGEASSRKSGLVGGTLHYMAPEQLRVGTVTPAADIYAFGLILFEIFTGSLPGATPSRYESECATHPETCPPLPRRWRAMLDASLHHDPAQRPSSATRIVQALGAGLPLSPSQWLAGLPAKHATLAKASIIFLLLVSLLGLGLRLYLQRAVASLPAGAPIYLAPLQNRTPQTAMNDISELLRASLSQSPQITLLEDARTGDALRSMGLPPDAPITPAVSREIAMRAGAVRAVVPTLSLEGGRFRLELKVEQPSGTPMRSRRNWTKHWTWAFGGDSTADAAHSVGDASDWVRHLAGESADDIARLSTPPEDVTTGSWDALSDYARAERFYAQTRREEAVAALETAVEKDRHFALAYALMGDILVNIGRRGAGFQAYAAALDDSAGERLSLRERARIKGIVAHDTGDLEAAEAAYREYCLYYPHDFIGWFRRGLPLYNMGRSAESVQVLERAHRVDPSRPTALVQLATDYLAMGNQARTGAVLQDLHDHYPRGYYLYAAVPAQVTRGDYSAAEESIAELARSETPAMRFAAVFMGANLQAERGNDAAADATLTEGLASTPGDATFLMRRAALRCHMQRFAECTKDVMAALQSDGSAAASLEASQVLGLGAAEAKGAGRAQLVSLLQAISRRPVTPSDGLSGEIAQRQVRGEALLAAGDARAAVAQLRAASALDPTVNLREPLARGLEIYASRQKDPSQATRLLTESLELRKPFAATPARIWTHSQLYPPGAFTQNLLAVLRLSGKLGQPPPREAMQQLTTLRVAASGAVGTNPE